MITRANTTDDVQTELPNWLLTSAAGLGVVALCGLFALTVPSFAVVLHELEIPLPLPTRAAIAVSAAAWISLGVSVATLLLVNSLLLRRRLCRMLDAAALACCALSLLLIVFAVIFTLIRTRLPIRFQVCITSVSRSKFSYRTGSDTRIFQPPQSFPSPLT
jgi:hypothetical protein